MWCERRVADILYPLMIMRMPRTARDQDGPTALCILMLMTERCVVCIISYFTLTCTIMENASHGFCMTEERVHRDSHTLRGILSFSS